MTDEGVEAIMEQVRRWASVALAGLIGAWLMLGDAGPARGAAAAGEDREWTVSGSVEAGGRISLGERSSSKFDEYRDHGQRIHRGVEAARGEEDAAVLLPLAGHEPRAG
jgi:hypothetical protein